MRATAHTFEPKTRLGRFEIVSLIGSGGMGAVYKAIDPDLGRAVAIKVLREAEEGSLGAVSRARMVREAQAMAKLAHPNVVPVHEIGAGEPLFIVMELVEGGTVREWLSMPRSIVEIIEVFVQAGRGLAAAHEAGLVHRDFKPDNILRGTDGRVRVVDFGLVVSGESHAGATPEIPPNTPLEASLTLTGIAVGTPAYMAPEQHRHEETDARTDQFSFAVTCYEAVYGERPFAGKTYREIVKKVYAGVVSPAPEGRAVPARIRTALLRALSVDPAARYPTMTALLAELTAPVPVTVVATATPPMPSPAPAVRSQRWIALAGFGVLAVGVGLVVAAPWSGSSSGSGSGSGSTPSALPSVPDASPVPVVSPDAPIVEPPPLPIAVGSGSARPPRTGSATRPPVRTGSATKVPPTVEPAGSGSADNAAELRRRQLELTE